MAVLLLVPDEYETRRGECDTQGGHCVPLGQYSMDGFWGVDGSLRLLALLGCCTAVAAFLLVALLLPETLPPEFRSTTTAAYCKEKWRELGRPWNTLRTFCTPTLRLLLLIKFLTMTIMT